MKKLSLTVFLALVLSGDAWALPGVIPIPVPPSPVIIICNAPTLSCQIGCQNGYINCLYASSTQPSVCQSLHDQCMRGCSACRRVSRDLDAVPFLPSLTGVAPAEPACQAGTATDWLMGTGLTAL